MKWILRKKNTLLLCDDFLNSGGQLVTIFKSLLGEKFQPGEINDEGDYRQKLTEEQIAKLKRAEIKAFFYKAFDQGIEKIENRLKKELGLNIHIARHTITNENMGIFGDSVDQEGILHGLSGYVQTECTFIGKKYVELTDLYVLLRKVGEQLLRINEPNWDEEKYLDRTLGYNNQCRIVLTDSNIPTISLTALWHEAEIKVDSKRIFWNKLFHRRKKKLVPEKIPIPVTISETDEFATFAPTLHDFICSFYLKNNVYYNFDNWENIVEKYSDLFKPIIIVKDNKAGFKFDYSQNIFDSITKHILESKSENPLLVNSFAGCGKSAFLSVLYLSLYHLYKTEVISSIPVLINLHKYNKEIYNSPTEPFQVQAIRKIKKDLEVLDNIIEAEDRHDLIVIIDGTDEYVNLKVDLEDYLFEKLSKTNVKTKIIGLRKHKEEHSRSYRKSKSIPFIEDPEIEIEITRINTSEDLYFQFVSAFSDVECLQYEKSKEEVEKYLLARVAEFKLEEVDTFILSMLANGMKAHKKYEGCHSLSSFYEKYFEVKSVDITKSAQIAFNLFNHPKSVSDREKNNDYWWRIQRHESMRDFLVAYHIVIKLMEYNGKNPEIFNYVYPYDINNFCKEIINSNPDYQLKCFDSITNLLPSLSLTAKTHFCYLLGRFENTKIKFKAIEYLNQLKTDLELNLPAHISYDSEEPLQRDDKMSLLYLRTIYISLTYLGDKTSSTNYIEQLISNKYFDNLNRGFHLEYYEDVVFDPLAPENLSNEDELGSFVKTFSRLYKKISGSINKGVPYPMFEIELYTLCSLAQHRHIAQKLDTETREKIARLIKASLDNQPGSSSKITKYFMFLQKKLESENVLKIGSFISDLFKLKELPRSGWLVKERGIENPETVASHMYGALLIAYFYLPNKIQKEKQYDKELILKMLFVHDIAEVKIGDLLPSEKTKEKMSEEAAFFDELSLLGTYNGVANVSELDKFYSDFQYGQSINGQIARDIDRLENLLQLFIYKKKFPDKILDFQSFKSELIRKINTEEGKKIRKIITDYFEEKTNG